MLLFLIGLFIGFAVGVVSFAVWAVCEADKREARKAEARRQKRRERG